MKSLAIVEISIRKPLAFAPATGAEFPMLAFGASRENGLKITPSSAVFQALSCEISSKS